MSDQAIALLPLAEPARENRRWFRFTGRHFLAAVLLGYFAVLLVSAERIGWRETWQRAGVPALSPPFADLRVITAGMDSARSGSDALVNNPADPWKRPMNYPRIWLLPRFLGVGAEHTVFLGFCIVAMFYASVFLLVGRVTLAEGACYAALLCSPTLMLALERGNIDLLMFGLVGLAAVLWHRCSRGPAAALILVASVLKLYPICALALVCRDRTRNALLCVAVAAAAFGAYLLLTLRDITAVIAATPAARFPAYGRELLFLRLSHAGFGGDPRQHALLLLAAFFVVALLCAWRLPAPRFSAGAVEKLVAGLAIYAGTFAFLSSFSYRMVFLLLAVPQLLLWCKEVNAYRYFAVATLALIATVLYLASARVSAAHWVKESATWLLFGSSVFLLLQTLRYSLPPCSSSRSARNSG